MSEFKNKLNPDFSDGVDRKLLKQVRDRFLQVNASRLQKCNEGLSGRHQDLLLVLPLLYHVNHILLPGFVSQDVVTGVSGYEPDKATLSIAKSFSQTFKFKSIGKHQAKIHSIFMMGSTGTLAHSEASDVDLWLCIDPELSAREIELLSQKALKIDEWANSLGLELHTFIVDAKRFKAGQTAGPADKESSGSAQHYLLLDEFYRTAILLAGRYPIWWLVPPEKEAEYEAIVGLFLNKRFLKETEVIDFGSASDIPKSELIGAGLWQLYKGLDSPYKSVLKILLAEVYAQELPAAPTLSQVFKQAVYDDELSPEDLDPYLLIYKRLESYLINRREHKRLDVVQKSFYLKVAKKLSRKPSSARGASWQRKQLEKLVRKWGWSDDKFKYLDNRSSWKVDQVLQERQSLVAELSFSYRFLSQYARANRIRSSITAEDLNLLGRKLYATFQKKAGKIERVNPGIVSSLWEENLSIHHSSSLPLYSGSGAWFVYRDIGTDSDPSIQVPLKKASLLIELLAWLYFNGILTADTRIGLSPGDSNLKMSALQNVVRAIEQSIPLPLPTLEQSNYLDAAHLTSVCLFINLGVDPLADSSESGLYVMSDKTDALNYSTESVNLVRTVDQISVNSWNEVAAHRYEAGETILQCLQAFLHVQLEQLSKQDIALQVHCFGTQRANAIAGRVKELFETALKVFCQGGEVLPARFVLSLGKKYYILQFIDEQFRYLSHDTEMELFRTLSQSQKAFSPVRIDDYALTSEVMLHSVLPYNLEGAIQVFYLSGPEVYQLVVLDEMGGVQRLLMPKVEESVLLSILDENIHRMLEGRQMSENFSDRGDLKVQLNRLARKKAGGYVVKTMNKLTAIELSDIVAMLTLGDSARGTSGAIDLLYQGVEFSFNEYGNQQYDALVHYAYEQAQLSARVPLAITEVVPNHEFGMVSQASYMSHRNQTQDVLRILSSTSRQLQRAVDRYFSMRK